MLPIKSVAFSCSKGGKLMKHALIGGLSVLAMIVAVSAANAQANINPNEYPRNAGERYGASGNAPYEWYGAPGPMRRGNMCVTHVDPLRGVSSRRRCGAAGREGRAVAGALSLRPCVVTQGEASLSRCSNGPCQ